MRAFFTSKVNRVEIVDATGSLLPVYFRLPEAMGDTALTEEVKQRVLFGINRATQEDKYADVIANVDLVQAELKHVANLQRWRPVRAALAWLPAIKNVAFVIAVLINCVLLLSYGAMSPSVPLTATSPTRYTSIPWCRPLLQIISCACFQYGNTDVNSNVWLVL